MEKVKCIKNKRIYCVDDYHGIAVFVSNRSSVVYFMNENVFETYKVSPMSCVVLNDAIYISNSENQLFSIDIKSKNMTKLPKGKIRSMRDNGMIVENHYIVCHDLNNVEIYDLETNRWTYIKNITKKGKTFIQYAINYDNTSCCVIVSDLAANCEMVYSLNYETLNISRIGSCNVERMIYDKIRQQYIAVTSGNESISILDQKLNKVKEYPLKKQIAWISRDVQIKVSQFAGL